MELDSGVLAVVAFGVVAVVVLAWLIVRNPPRSVDQVQPMILEASETARLMVMAAQQLWQTGRLPSDQRFDWVADRLRAQYDLEPAQVGALIEAGVYWVKHLTPTTATAATTTAAPGTGSGAGTAQPLEAQGLPVKRTAHHA